MLKIAGKLEAIGQLLPENIPADPAARAGAVVRMLDGRQVTISGLTHEECRRLAGDLGEPLTLKLEGLPC